MLMEDFKEIKAELKKAKGDVLKVVEEMDWSETTVRVVKRSTSLKNYNEIRNA